MSMQDVITRAQAEQTQRREADLYRAAPLRLPEELWQRLDRLALEFGWSRNRLLVELIDEGTFELAFRVCSQDGTLADRALFEWFTGEECDESTG